MSKIGRLFVVVCLESVKSEAQFVWLLCLQQLVSMYMDTNTGYEIVLLVSVV